MGCGWFLFSAMPGHSEATSPLTTPSIARSGISSYRNPGAITISYNHEAAIRAVQTIVMAGMRKAVTGEDARTAAQVSSEVAIAGAGEGVLRNGLNQSGQTWEQNQGDDRRRS